MKLNKKPFAIIFTSNYFKSTGKSLPPFIFIHRNKMSNDILQHELKHNEQFYRNPFKAILYPFIKSIRLEMEAEAYATSIKHGMSFSLALYNLFNYYNLNYPRDYIEKKLTFYLENNNEQI